jgi:hypothetical protein
VPCKWIRMPGGGMAHLKMSATPRKRCSVCGNLGASKLCDFELAGKTCDKPLCGRCAIHRKPDSDFCPDHTAETLPLFPGQGQ